MNYVTMTCELQDLKYFWWGFFLVFYILSSILHVSHIDILADLYYFQMVTISCSAFLCCSVCGVLFQILVPFYVIWWFDGSLIACLLFYHVFGGQLKLFLVFTWVLGFGFWCGFCSIAFFFILARFQSSGKNCSNYLSLFVVCSIFFILFLGLFYILWQLSFCTEWWFLLLWYL